VAGYTKVLAVGPPGNADPGLASGATIVEPVPVPRAFALGRRYPIEAVSNYPEGWMPFTIVPVQQIRAPVQSLSIQAEFWASM
jgi:hypothetical protein